MKKILFLLIATVCANVLMSQELQDYYCKETVSGNKYTYTVKKYSYSKKFALKNVNNIEYVTINGEERYITTEFGFFIKLNNPNVVIEAIEAVFSKEEILEMAKACVAFERENYDSNSKYSYFYGFCPDVDKDGKIVNLEIEFYSSNTMKNVPPQKIEQLEDYIKEHAVYTVKDKERVAHLQIISAQPIEVDVDNTDYSFKLMYDTNKY